MAFNFKESAYKFTDPVRLFKANVAMEHDQDRPRNGITPDKLDTSGFMYQNRFVRDTADQILLDESAANTFANAKNGAMGTSNRSRLCTIYHSDTQTGGAAADTNDRDFGPVGFRTTNIFDLTRDV